MYNAVFFLSEFSFFECRKFFSQLLKSIDILSFFFQNIHNTFKNSKKQIGAMSVDVMLILFKLFSNTFVNWEYFQPSVLFREL